MAGFTYNWYIHSFISPQNVIAKKYKNQNLTKLNYEQNKNKYSISTVIPGVELHNVLVLYSDSDRRRRVGPEKGHLPVSLSVASCR